MAGALLEALAFQSTPPARRATVGLWRIRDPGSVSIHAPRAEGDFDTLELDGNLTWFQSTPPARRATSPLTPGSMSTWFQSTPPARRATCGCSPTGWWVRCFNPRPPRGGRRLLEEQDPAGEVSIHAPRAEGDNTAVSIDDYLSMFQSTPPARRATRRRRRGSRRRRSFNPRPPRGGRRGAARTATAAARRFNPRPPRGGRRADEAGARTRSAVSIHAPRAEGDPRALAPGQRQDVSIHAPRAEGDVLQVGRCPRELVSIHAPRAEGDAQREVAGHPRVAVSIHAPRAEGDRPTSARRRRRAACFNPRPPRGGRPPAWRSTSR